MTSREPDGTAADAVARAADLVSREDAAARDAMARPARRRRAPLLALMWTLLAVNGVIWLAFPPSGPDATDPRDPAGVERDLRLTVAAVAGEVDSYRAGHGGSLPSSLRDAQVDDSTLAYSVLDPGTYEISATDGGVRVTYRSTSPVTDFLARQAGGRR